MFERSTIKLENGKTFIINAKNAGRENFYVNDQTFSGSKINNGAKFILKSSKIDSGAEIDFKMDEKPGTSKAQFDYFTSIPGNDFVINPIIEGGGSSFQKTKTVPITSSQKNTSIYFTTDGSEPTNKSTKYKQPLIVNESQTVKAIAYSNTGKKSFVTTAIYKKMLHNWQVKLNSTYEQMYDGGGGLSLIDGIRGDTNWRKGNWQGYQKNSLDVVIDLKIPTTISTVTAGFLQDTRAWIVAPKQMIVLVSDDGVDYKTVSDINNFLPVEDLNPKVKNVTATFEPTKARFVGIKALQYGKLPNWHESPGGDTHLFVDEIEIK